MEEVKWWRVSVGRLKNFIVEIFTSIGTKRHDAEITADVLVTSDQRGIASHGVARLKRYVDGIGRGVMIPNAEIEILKETPVSLLVTGNNGLGQPVSYKTMEKLILKACKSGIAFATVRNSNHYGIAGYYSMMALEKNFIGISMTNSAPLVVPTNAKNMAFGTNPISIAIPTKEEFPWVLDMATSTVPRGKLEVYARQNKSIPIMWATDAEGLPTNDPALVLDNVLNRIGGGLLPLGGVEEISGGHKGYGLGTMVDIFSGILSGGSFGLNVYGHGKDAPPDVCHFFGVINPSLFIPIDKFVSSMDEFIKELRNKPTSKGQDRIWIHGEKEWISQRKNAAEVPIEVKVIDNMNEIAGKLGIYSPFK